MEEIIRNIWPLFAIQIVIQIFALVNLSKRRKVRFDNKLIWVLIIIFGSLIGSIAYFVFRGEEDDDSSED